MKFGVLTIQKAAEIYGVHQSTIHRAIKEGKIKSVDYEKQKGIYIIRESAVKKLYKKKKEDN
jgi:excisionase family DNA binding protein